MYEEQKCQLEANFVRSELRPVPGGWWLSNSVVDGKAVYAAPDGVCCALSPSVAGHPITMSPSQILGHEYALPRIWINGAIDGFDEEKRLWEDDERYMDGYAWGKYMLEKYVLPQRV